jgi:DNA-binding SARP family transcriptional activator
MLHLSLLGATDFTADDGRTLHSVLAHPKRLALLAYLAVASPPGFHRRDALLALFWPESDEERARSSLRQSVYSLRRSLGSEMIQSRGEEVGIDPERLSCDAARFDALLEAGDAEGALSLYRGDFLEGFHLPDAPEFERWVDAERERLRRQAAGAAWEISEVMEERGNGAEALRWARRARAFAPEEEASLRRLLALLDRMGERAEAVREYEAFAERLAAEYELEPSPETQALLAGIRAREAPAGSAPAQPGAAVPIPEAGLPASTQIIEPAGAVPATTAGSELDGSARTIPREAQSRRTVRVGMGAAVTLLLLLAAASAGLGGRDRETRLQDGPFPASGEKTAVTVLPVHASLSGSAESGARFLSTAIAGELGRVPGIALTDDARAADFRVKPTMLQSPDSVVLWATIVGGGSPELLSIPPVRVPRTALAVGIQQLARRVAGSTALRMDYDFGSLAPYTSQPSSYGNYARMVAAYRGEYGPHSDVPDLTAVRATLQSITEADSAFTLPLLAYARIASSNDRCSEVEEIERMLVPHERALPAFEAHWLRILAARCRGKWESALDYARELAAAAPASMFANAILANCLRLTHRAREAARVAESFPEMLYGPGVFGIAIQAHHAAGNHPQELKLVQENLRRYPSGPIYDYVVSAYAALGREAKLAETVEDAEAFAGYGVNAGDVAYRAGAELAAHGKPHAAREYFARAVHWYRARPSVITSDVLRERYGMALLAAGELSAAAAVFDSLSSRHPTDIQVLGGRGMVAASLGDRATAARIDALLAVLEGSFTRGAPTLWRARVAERLGDRKRAIRMLRGALARGATISADYSDAPINDSVLHQIPDLQDLLREPEIARLVRPKG